MKPQAMKQGLPQWVIYLLMIGLIAISGVIFYLYIQKGKQIEVLQSATSSAVVYTSDEVIASVAKLLPEFKDQKPAVALIKDIVEVSKPNPEFYKDAKNGDYFLLYPNKAVVYRPGENRIINSATVTK
jgi:hypothetical protein